jgi:hypothetical protein
MNTIGTHNNVPLVHGAILGIGLSPFLGQLKARNSFLGQDSIFVLEIVVQSLKKHLSVDED